METVVSIKPLLTVQNSYRNIFRGKVNFCSLLKHTEENIFITPMINYWILNSITNLLDGCPYKAVKHAIIINCR